MKPFVYFFLSVSICGIGFSQDNYNIKNLEINNEYAHFGLMPVGNNQILFTSFKVNKRGKVMGSLDNPPLTIYKGRVSSNGEITNSQPVLIDAKANIEHITSAAISPDGKQLYITTYYTSKNKPKGNFKATNFHLEVGEYIEGVGWTNFKVLPFCLPKYSYGHPALSKDGKTLYFIANIRGGKQQAKGGSDIYKVEILDNNTYTEPLNLGSSVNSYSREMFPYLSEDNTLYFSSNRPNGYGGFDIYKCEMQGDGTFKKAEKMPKPINSSASDFSFILVDGKSGYFSSKRKEGKGDDDIFYFSQK